MSAAVVWSEEGSDAIVGAIVSGRCVGTCIFEVPPVPGIEEKLANNELIARREIVGEHLVLIDRVNRRAFASAEAAIGDGVGGAGYITISNGEIVDA